MSENQTLNTPSNTSTPARRKKTWTEDPDLKVFAIYPDYWKDSWGPEPCLGHVRAYSEFYAKYKAYDKGLLPYNFTFGPKAVEVSKPKHKNKTPSNG